MKNTSARKSAWLVTWTGTTGVPDDPVVTILNHRYSARSVQNIVEQLYLALRCDHSDKLNFATRSKDSPFRAQPLQFERVLCGHNPFLYARRVSKLNIADDKLVWTEPPSVEEMRKPLIEAGLLRG